MSHTNESNRLKLTKAQKDVVRKMRIDNRLTIMHDGSSNDFFWGVNMLGNINNRTVQVLIWHEIISNKNDKRFYILTPLGRTIGI